MGKRGITTRGNNDPNLLNILLRPYSFFLSFFNFISLKMKPTLVILAAGMGSRYGGGGLKQIDAM